MNPPDITSKTDDVLSKTTEEMADKISMAIDVRIKMALKPKPSFLPTFIWAWLIGQLLNVEIIQGKLYEKDSGQEGSQSNKVG